MLVIVIALYKKNNNKMERKNNNKNDFPINIDCLPTVIIKLGSRVLFPLNFSNYNVDEN